MHPSLILLTLASLLLIIFMVTCFICFVRSRRKEDEELMEQVQYSNHQRQQQQQQYPADQQQQILTRQLTPQRHKLSLSPSPSDNMMINDQQQQLRSQQQAYGQQSHQQQQQQVNHQQQQQADILNPMMGEYQARNSYAVAAASPYHTPSSAILGASGSPVRTETRADMTQQINSAIIGSSEAEFQNDFIQVFPMYQIAPQPEKNTTPYLT